MGGMFDWRHEVSTTDPAYYKWTQWIFLQLYKAGKAYKKLGAVNWCPECKTVLANEQVIDGYCERRANHVMKLSMIVNASRTSKMVVTRKDLERAISIIEATEVKMRNTFRGVGQLSYADILTKIMNVIGMEKCIMSSELLSRFSSDIDKWRLDQIIESLKHSKFVHVIHTENDVRIIHRKSYEEGKVDIEGNYGNFITIVEKKEE